MGWLDSLFGSSKPEEQKTTNEYVQLPDYAESEGARGLVWDKLQGWGNQPGYGAIAPNWQDIWDQAQKRVSQYYWGSATDPGVVGKMKADAARRGQAGQPAGMRNIARMGKSEADMLSEMAVKQATEQAQFSESGRRNWMSDLQNLMGQKPNFQVGSTTTTRTPASGGEGWDWLSNLSGLFGQGMTSAGAGGEDFDWMNLLPIGLEALGSSFGVPGIGTLAGNAIKGGVQSGKANIKKDSNEMTIGDQIAMQRA